MNPWLNPQAAPTPLGETQTYLWQRENKNPQVMKFRPDKTSRETVAPELSFSESGMYNEPGPYFQVRTVDGRNPAPSQCPEDPSFHRILYIPRGSDFFP